MTPPLKMYSKLVLPNWTVFSHIPYSGLILRGENFEVLQILLYPCILTIRHPTEEIIVW